MRALAVVGAVVNVALFCAAFILFGEAIKMGANQLLWLLVTIALMVTLVWVTCYVMRLPEGGAADHAA